MATKHIVRLVKSEHGESRFEEVTSTDDVIKLAGRGGALDLAEEFGVPDERIPSLDIVTRLAIGAGLDALRDAGIPLVMRYKTTTRGTKLPERWALPEALQDDTGIIFASAFPGLRLLRRARRAATTSTTNGTSASPSWRRSGSTLAAQGRRPEALAEVDAKVAALKELLEKEPYVFDRRFLFRILSMGHSQFAELIGARGPNTQINSACGSMGFAVGLAEDWIRAGRCRRVLVVSADDATSDQMMEWIGAGFVASGAAALDEKVEDAALPFDRRRHGMVIGMGAAAFVVESAEAARERGITPICRVLSAVTGNSAFHGTRLDVNHIAQVMETLVSSAERKWGIERHAIAPHTVFVSHETYTPGARRKRLGRGLRPPERLRRLGRRDRHGQHEGLHGARDGHRHRGRRRREDARDRSRPADPELPGGRPRARAASSLEGGPVRLRLRAAPRRRLRLADHHDPDRARSASGRTAARARGARLRLPRERPGPLPLLALGHQRLRRSRDRGREADLPREERRRALASVAEARRPGGTRARRERARRPGGSDARARPGDGGRGSRFGNRRLHGRGSRRGFRCRTRPAVAEDPVESPRPRDRRREDRVRLRRCSPSTSTSRPTSASTPSSRPSSSPRCARSGGFPRDDNRKLRDYPTLARVIQFVRDSRPDLPKPGTGASGAPAPASSVAGGHAAAPAAAAPAMSHVDDPVLERVLAIVTEKTGYPAEMLDLDLDLEADLGVDTVKQAELFTAVREEWGIPRDDNRKLRDYPTLAHVVQFVRDSRPDLAEAVVRPPRPGTGAALPLRGSTPPQPAPAPAVRDPVLARVLAIVTEKTGYPAEMLDPELDLEADLGVDTVKQAELFTAVREEWGIPRDDNRKLRDYPTLAHVVQFVRDSRPDLPKAVATAAGSAPAVPAPAAGPAAPASDPVLARVLAIVTEKTGYPAEMLDPELDLEADLGVDTVKQAELFTAVREEWGIPRDDNRKLRDYPTLAHVVRFVHDNRPDLVKGAAAAPRRRRSPRPAPRTARLRPPSPPSAASPRRRRFPGASSCRSSARPSRPASRPASRSGTAGASRSCSTAAARRRPSSRGSATRGVDVLTLENGATAESLAERLAEWTAGGPVHGLFWLPALDVEGDLGGLDLAGLPRGAPGPRQEPLRVGPRALRHARRARDVPRLRHAPRRPPRLRRRGRRRPARRRRDRLHEGLQAREGPRRSSRPSTSPPTRARLGRRRPPRRGDAARPGLRRGRLRRRPAHLGRPARAAASRTARPA